MSWETHPVIADRFEDFADVVNPNRRETHCWCVTHRLRQQDIDALGAGNREHAMRALCERENPPGDAPHVVTGRIRRSVLQRD